MILLNVFVDRFKEGGPFFMSLILICLLCALVFLAMGFVNLKKNTEKSIKMRNIAVDVSLLGLVIGFLGSIIGLIGAFDAVGNLNKINRVVFGGGIKMTFLTIFFGLFTFIISRIGILVLRGLQKE